MTPELLAWLQANGLTRGPESDPYNLGDGGGRAVIGNSGLYRNEDETPEAFLQRVYQQAMGSGEWGTAGRGINDLQSAGFVNGLSPVDVGGVQYARVGENIADPGFRERLLKNVAKPENITRFFDQYDPASVSKYDPAQGWLMQKDKYDELVRAIDSTRSGGFFAENTPWDAFSKTIGTAMGLSGAIASGLGYAASNPSMFGSFADTAAGALSTAGATGGPYQSLWSSLGANAASQGGSLADILKAAGGSSGSLPSSYWSMLADAGGTVSDASGGIPDNVWSSLYSDAAAGTGMFAGAPFTGTLSELKSLIAPAGGAMSIPGISTIGSSGAIPGASGGSFFSDMFTPRNLLGAGTTLLGSGLNALSASKAAGAQIDSANQANALTRDMYQQNRADLAPWRETGVAALGRLRNMLTPGNQFTAMQADPGYQFRVDQGNKAIERSAAARGKLFSPQTMNAVSQRTQDVASNEFGNVSNRLMALAGLGQTATNTGVAAGANAANQQAQNITGAGNARASGYVGAANAVSGGLSNFLRNMQEQDLMNLLLGSR